MVYPVGIAEVIVFPLAGLALAVSGLALVFARARTLPQQISRRLDDVEAKSERWRHEMMVLVEDFDRIAAQIERRRAAIAASESRQKRDHPAPQDQVADITDPVVRRQLRRAGRG